VRNPRLLVVTQADDTKAETRPPTVSLDLEAGAFRGLTLREINNATETLPNRPGMVQFRQVSADPAHPAYFVRHPSLQYGQAPENGKAAWDKVTELCSHLGNGTLSQALAMYVDLGFGKLTDSLRVTLLHALPIINYPQFEQACRGQEGSGPIPYALIAATMAHSASYMATLRPLHQPLWAHVLNALDAEFRQPRLQTLQLSILLLSSRPGVNFAQSDITLSRVSGSEDCSELVSLLSDCRCCTRTRSSHRPFPMVSSALGTVTSDKTVLERALP
jgi:hypothetical protein